MATTYTKSVTIEPGETFTLPPGASVMGSTDPDSLLSSCDPVPLITFQCYVFIAPQQNDTGGGGTFGQTEIFQEDNIQYTGVKYNGKFYPFASRINWSDEVGLTRELQNLASIGSLILGISYTPVLASRGHKKYILFSTVTSVGDYLELVGETQLITNNDSAFIVYNIPAFTRDKAVDNGNAGIPECSTITTLN